MIVPTKIILVSDGNILQFESEAKGRFNYRYIKSKTKKGELLTLTETELQNLINVNSIWER